MANIFEGKRNTEATASSILLSLDVISALSIYVLPKFYILKGRKDRAGGGSSEGPDHALYASGAVNQIHLASLRPTTPAMRSIKNFKQTSMRLLFGPNTAIHEEDEDGSERSKGGEKDRDGSRSSVKNLGRTSMQLLFGSNLSDSSHKVFQDLMEEVEEEDDENNDGGDDDDDPAVDGSKKQQGKNSSLDEELDSDDDDFEGSDKSEKSFANSEDSTLLATAAEKKELTVIDA